MYAKRAIDDDEFIGGENHVDEDTVNNVFACKEISVPSPPNLAHPFGQVTIAEANGGFITLTNEHSDGSSNEINAEVNQAEDEQIMSEYLQSGYLYFPSTSTLASTIQPQLNDSKNVIKSFNSLSSSDHFNTVAQTLKSTITSIAPKLETSSSSSSSPSSSSLKISIPLQLSRLFFGFLLKVTGILFSFFGLPNVLHWLLEESSLTGSPFSHLQVSSSQDNVLPVIASVWNPHYPQLALATSDHCIHIYDVLTSTYLIGGDSGIPSISHPQMNSIVSLSWKPQSSTVLAVGTTTSILLFTLSKDIYSQASRTQRQQHHQQSQNDHQNTPQAQKSSASPYSPYSYPYSSNTDATRPRTPLTKVSYPRTPSAFDDENVDDHNTSSSNINDHMSLNREAKVWSYPGHAPVTTLSWSSTGRYLASGSSADSAICIWSLCTSSPEIPTVLRRVTSAGTTLLSWSPTSDYLIQATSESYFRIWETRSWEQEKWSNLSSPIGCVQWSNNGSTLLFSCLGDSSLYSLSLNPSVPPVINANFLGSEDLSPAIIPTTIVENPTVIVGGPIQSFSWDPTNNRLAIKFLGEESGSELIAIFSTSVAPYLKLFPLGFVRGPPNSQPINFSYYPSKSSFLPSPHFPSALLATLWSNGELRFCPQYF